MMNTKKISPYVQFYDLNVTTNPYFLLKYKHLIINNRSGDVITGRLNNEIIFIIDGNDILEMFDLFSDDIIETSAGVRITLSSSGANSSVRIFNFGI